MAEYGWHCGNFCRFGARNSVINATEKCAKELWHYDCIFPKRKMAGTAFLALLHTEWCKKRCFCVLTRLSECGNNVSGWFQTVLVNGNNVVMVSAITIWQIWKHFSKERRNGIIDAYGVISGNVGNESVLVSRTSWNVVLADGGHGNGQIPARGIGA